MTFESEALSVKFVGPRFQGPEAEHLAACAKTTLSWLLHCLVRELCLDQKIDPHSSDIFSLAHASGHERDSTPSGTTLSLTSNSELSHVFTALLSGARLEPVNGGQRARL